MYDPAMGSRRRARGGVEHWQHREATLPDGRILRWTFNPGPPRPTIQTPWIDERPCRLEDALPLIRWIDHADIWEHRDPRPDEIQPAFQGYR